MEAKESAIDKQNHKQVLNLVRAQTGPGTGTSSSGSDLVDATSVIHAEASTLTVTEPRILGHHHPLPNIIRQQQGLTLSSTIHQSDIAL